MRTYVDPHDLPDGRVELFGVVVVDGDDVRPANVLLCVGMLGGNLRKELLTVRKKRRVKTLRAFSGKEC